MSVQKSLQYSYLNEVNKRDEQEDVQVSQIYLCAVALHWSRKATSGMQAWRADLAKPWHWDHDISGVKFADFLIGQQLNAEVTSIKSGLIKDGGQNLEPLKLISVGYLHQWENTQILRQKDG